MTAACAAGLVMTALAQTGPIKPQGVTKQDPTHSPFYDNGLLSMPDQSTLIQHGYYAGQNSYPFAGASETDKLARQLAQAKGEGERESIRARLTLELEKQFDQRQKKHQADSEALEAQIKKLKDLIRTRNENRRDIISRRLEQIVHDAQGLGW